MYVKSWRHQHIIGGVEWGGGGVACRADSFVERIRAQGSWLQVLTMEFVKSLMSSIKSTRMWLLHE